MISYNNKMNNELANHWDNKYSLTETEKLGWYEELPEPSLTLINDCYIDKNDLIIDVGSGTSKLIDALMSTNYTNIIATDISKIALDKAKKRLQSLIPDKAENCQFIIDDILNPKHIDKLKDVSIWHDRAVFHFLIDEKDQQKYLQVLKKIVKKDGYVIISTFAIGGINTCSGLPVKQYNLEMLIDFLGDDFNLVESFNYDYITTWGQKRPFIYTKFIRIKK